MPAHGKAKAAGSFFSDRPGRRDHERLSDRVWMGCGVALAVVAAVGAAFEIRINDGRPKIYGGAHLALFSQPMRAHEQATLSGSPRPEGPSATSAAIVQDDLGRRGIDFETTATIGKREAPDAEHVVEVGPPYLVFVERAHGIFMTESGQRVLGIGEVAPGGGTIRAFRRRQGHWVAIVALAQTSR